MRGSGITVTNADCLRVIGIDLGTTYSSVAYLTGQGPQVIPDCDMVAIPSIVAFQDGEWQVGRLAADRACKYPRTTVFDTKRMLGCSFDMPAIQAARKMWPFPVVRGPDGEILIEIQEGSRIRRYRPYELSAKILAKLKVVAARGMRTAPENVTEAVITVPAYFNDSQRADTKKAAEIAGLKVLGLLSEPAAGALAHGFRHGPAKKKKTVLVFDFGGGTLDLSLVELDGNGVNIQAVSGDTHLGGRDFDEALMRLCLRQFDRTSQARVCKITSEEYHLLRPACEDAKCHLTESTRADVCLRAFREGRDLEVNITRERFARWSHHLLDRIRPPLEEVLEFGGIKASEVDEIITIGGSSLIPAVQDALARFFFPKAPSPDISPLEVVAKGAAIMAGKIKGGSDIPRIQNLEFRDICALSMGVDVVGERMGVVIPAGTRLPATAKRIFETSIHGQAVGRFQVFEGPWLMTKRNRLLGSFEVEGIPAAEAGREQVELTFNIDSDRILTVTAAILSRGTTTSFTVRKTGCLLGTKAIQRIQAQNETEKAIDAREFEEAGRRSWLKLVAENLEKFFANEPNDPTDGKAFLKMVSKRKRGYLLKYLQSRLPDPDGPAPTREEIDLVFGNLRYHLFGYFNDRKGGIPDWLEPYKHEGYIPVDFLA
jgi:molecular chaperone DnaK (HSP70)